MAPEPRPSFADDALLDVKAAASYLNVSESFVRQLCNLPEGDPERIAHVRLGNRIRIPFWGLKVQIAQRSGATMPPGNPPAPYASH